MTETATDNATATSLSLWDMAEGQIAEIVSFSSGLADNFRRRLQEIGFLPGGEVVCVLTTELGAPRLYRVYNSVFSLDDNIAQHVQITLRDQ